MFAEAQGGKVQTSDVRDRKPEVLGNLSDSRRVPSGVRIRAAILFHSIVHWGRNSEECGMPLSRAELPGGSSVMPGSQHRTATEGVSNRWRLSACCEDEANAGLCLQKSPGSCKKKLLCGSAGRRERRHPVAQKQCLLRVGGGGAGADKAAGVGKSNVGTYWPMKPALIIVVPS